MINSVLIAITQALDRAFGYPVAIDNVEQELETPSFLITPLTLTEKHIINERYERNFHYIIQYFPKGKEYHMECNEVAEMLMNTLYELDTKDGIIRASGDMKTNVVDGVLTFEVQYKPLVVKVNSTHEEAGELMETLTQINTRG